MLWKLLSTQLSDLKTIGGNVFLRLGIVPIGSKFLVL